MSYQVHEVRPGESEPFQTREYEELEVTRDIAEAWAKEVARERETKAVWCNGDAFHEEAGLRPVGGYDIGEPEAENPRVIIYEVIG